MPFPTAARRRDVTGNDGVLRYWLAGDSLRF